VINNKDGELIYQKNLANVAPSYNEEPYYFKGGIWYYYKTINIPKNVGETFLVQIKDEATGNAYTFKVTGNQIDNEGGQENVITTVQK